MPVNEPKGFRGTGEAHQRALGKLIGVSPESLKELWQSHEPEAHRENERNSDALVRRWREVNSERRSRVGNVFLDWCRIRGPVAHDPERAAGIVASLEVESGSEALSGKDGELVIRRALEKFLPRAFRRPVGESDLEPLVRVYRREREAGATHRRATRRALVAALVSPHFLYLGTEVPPDSGEEGPERGQDESSEPRQSVPQLATRLSFLFWQTTPDDSLVKAVTSLDRGDPIALERLASRMLEDPRADRFFRDFTSRWLGLEPLGREKTPDSELFREFSGQLAADMRSEIALRFRAVILEERSLLELLDGEKTFLNERLARLYGVDSIEGTEFRPYSLAGSGRGGLLGTAGVLTATSLPARTSPVQRGKFVVETLLGESLPPPPEDAGELDEEAGQSVSTTLREQLAEHRDRPSCLGCHQRIDPIGFALEKYDYVGRRRERDPSGPIDEVGVLPDGQEVAGLDGLNAYLREHRAGAFIDNLTRRLLTYGLGRTLDHRDEADVRRIVEAVRRRGSTGKALIHEIVRSRPFQALEAEREPLPISE